MHSTRSTARSETPAQNPETAVMPQCEDPPRSPGMKPSRLDLPAAFVKNVTQSFPDGAAWLRRLPMLIDEASRRWELTIGDPFLLSYNFVCAAYRSDGSPAVLKIGVPNVELTSEINALRLYAGQGACLLLETDASQGMLLLERLLPGSMLTGIRDDGEATRIAARVLRSIHRPAPAAEGFLSLRDWFAGLKKMRQLFHGGTGPYPEGIVREVEGILAELFAEKRPQVLLHGDFHHYNVLLSDRGWLCIDPKGVIGEAEYDLGPLLVNPIELRLGQVEALRRTRDRLDILVETLGFERQRIIRWAYCFSLLSSYWDLSQDGSGNDETLTWIEIFARINKGGL